MLTTRSRWLFARTGLIRRCVVGRLVGRYIGGEHAVKHYGGCLLVTEDIMSGKAMVKIPCYKQPC